MGENICPSYFSSLNPTDKNLSLKEFRKKVNQSQALYPPILGKILAFDIRKKGL
jgi:hypothetical protein